MRPRRAGRHRHPHRDRHRGMERDGHRERDGQRDRERDRPSGRSPGTPARPGVSRLVRPSGRTAESWGLEVKLKGKNLLVLSK